MRKRYAKAAITVLLGGALSGLLAGPAAAHAELEWSSPAAGSVVPVSPDAVRLGFNEQVTVQADQFMLLDPAGAPLAVTVSGQDAPDGRTTVTVVPDTELPAGSWVASWKAVSADGHVVGGTVPFTIGSTTTAAASSSAAGEAGGFAVSGPGAMAADGSKWADRLLELMSWLVALAAAAVLIGRPGRRLGVLAGVGLAAALVRAGADVAGSGFEFAVASGEFRATLLVAAAGCLAVVAALRTPGRPAVLLAGTAVGLFAFQGTQSGHQLAAGGTAGVLVHVVHVAAAAVWAGAVLAFALNVSAGQAARTRRAATWAVACLVPSAVVLALIVSGVLVRPFEWSSWAVLLTVKLLLVLAALGLGLANHQALAPARLSVTLGSRARIRRFLMVELGVLAFVAIVTVLMVGQSPRVPFDQRASSPPPAAETATAAGASVPVVSSRVPVSIRLDDGSAATIEVPSGPAGTWTVLVDGPVADGSGVISGVHAPSGAVLNPVELESAGGKLVGVGGLPLDGEWNLVVSLRRDAFSEVSGSAVVVRSPARLVP